MILPMELREFYLRRLVIALNKASRNAETAVAVYEAGEPDSLALGELAVDLNIIVALSDFLTGEPMGWANPEQQHRARVILAEDLARRTEAGAVKNG